jgi:hypothetical protein
MKFYRLLPLIILISLSGCKSQKQITKKSTPPPQKKEKNLSEEERQKMLQKVYVPEENIKPISPEDEKNIDALAKDLAGYTCKKEALQKLADGGETVNPDQIKFLDEMVAKISDKAKGIANDPIRWKLFQSKLDQHLNECLH